MISYWEQAHMVHFDHLIIGGGLVGLSTAIEIKTLFPDHRVGVLERGLFPSGASTKNAGFACMGSLSELIDDEASLSTDDIVALFRLRQKGLQRLRQRLGDRNIDYREEGSYELLAGDYVHCLDHMDTWNAALAPLLDQDAFRRCDEKLSQFGFHLSIATHLVENTCEGSINTGKMMRALQAKATSLGVELFTNTKVEGVEENTNTVRVILAEDQQLSTQHLYCCTNAFSRQFLPDLDVQPGRGQVLVTTPIADLPFQGIFHYEAGYYYFRTHENRVLFGGGRHIDKAGECSTDLALHADIQATLEQQLRDYILPGRAVTIDQRWSGIMAFGANKQPIIGSKSERIHYAVRLGGMGIAMGSQVAHQLVKQVATCMK